MDETVKAEILAALRNHAEAYANWMTARGNADRARAQLSRTHQIARLASDDSIVADRELVEAKRVLDQTVYELKLIGADGSSLDDALRTYEESA